VDRDDHRGILARGITRLIILGLDAASVPVQYDERVFPRTRDAIPFSMQYWYAIHQFAPLTILSRSIECQPAISPVYGNGEIVSDTIFQNAADALPVSSGGLIEMKLR
jgi:hypothetical protein